MTVSINDKTTIAHQNYLQSIRNGQITDGLSNEAIGYVRTAIARTTEDHKYNIFENGLMPEDATPFFDGNFSNLIYQVEIDENTWQSKDGRLEMHRNVDDDSRTISYDSDGVNGFDRTATYKYINGYSDVREDDIDNSFAKIEETFDADGDGTNEVVLRRDWHIGVDTTTETVKNPDYTNQDWWTDFFTLFTGGTGKSRTIEEEVSNYYFNNESQHFIGVNADDLGYDDKYGEHFEYVECNNVYNHMFFQPPQLYLSWPSETKSEFTINECYGNTGFTTYEEKYFN